MFVDVSQSSGPAEPGLRGGGGGRMQCAGAASRSCAGITVPSVCAALFCKHPEDLLYKHSADHNPDRFLLLGHQTTS